MLRTVIGGKIHRATVTHADLSDVDSITVDEHLVRAAGMRDGERVQVVDITNGARMETSIASGASGSGQIRVNGAVSRLVTPGDLIIIMSFLGATERELGAHEPRVAHVDPANRLVDVGADPAAPVPGSIDQIPSR